MTFPRATLAVAITTITTAAGITLAATPVAPAASAPAPATGPQTIQPGALWPDSRGQHVQAHGGGIIRLPDTPPTTPGTAASSAPAAATGFTYYWFGEERAQSLQRNQRAVSCYSSKDLVHWTFRKDVLVCSATDAPILERPKVYYNAKTQKFVMYMHLDNNGYSQAEVGVATCDTVDGTYTPLKHFRPLNHESRDIGQFIDDDGTAYLIFEDRPNGWHIAKLSDDYLSVEKDVHLFPQHMEGGAMVHYDGLYYAIGSNLTGWNANPNTYATAKSLEGPWSDFKDIAPHNTNTYGAQSTMLVKIVGTKTTSIIFMGDLWRPNSQWDSRYLWMPLEIGAGNLRLPEPRQWTLDIRTGEAVIDKDAPAMTLPAPPAARGPRGRSATSPASAPAP